MTCGSEIGNADRYNRALCQAKGLACMGTAQIVMPENYIAMFSAPQAEEARQIVARAPSRTSTASSPPSGRAGPSPRPGGSLYDRFMSGPVNPIFYSCFVKATRLHCRQCLHPAAASASSAAPPTTSPCKTASPSGAQNCTHCMACICYCPAEAIEYGKKSRGKPRYHFEAL